MQHGVLSGAGLGYRTEIAADILSHASSIDFVEVVAEALLASPWARREVRALSELFPVIPHGVKLSLGSADGLDLERVRRFGALARELRSPVVSEHAAFTRSGGYEVGHLTHLPYTAEALRVLVRNIGQARRYLPDVPFLIENAAANFEWRVPQLDEGSFYVELTEQAGCPLLLDVANLYANAVNLGRDPVEVARSYPLSRVAMIHMAGGVKEHGFYFDTHAHAVPEAVFDLLRFVLQHTGPVPVLVERDADFPPFSMLLAELEQSRALLAEAQRSEPFHVRQSEIPEGMGLEEAQTTMAITLTRPEKNDDPSLERARQVLMRKRVDDAMPLIPHLGARAAEVRTLALSVVRGRARAMQRNAFQDAWAIASAASGEADFAVDAARDIMLLRTRCIPGAMRPRVAPFVGHQSLPDGSGVWSFKGLGADAAVRLVSLRR